MNKLVPWEKVKTLPEFYDRMKAYDWTTAMSDDHRVWQRGEWSWANEFEPCLERMKKSHGEQALMLFAAMRSWAWGNGELPPRPEESGSE
jgi:hypothetical protein